ncbi:hypothetical protein BSP75_01350 [Aeromonas sp. YN13HZO-058]|uniref:acyltransferase n=1 Tax=Aeromonas sp. YN13HZO-058 TaxID=1921564 RepID=UPI000946CEC4|nr:acyltransferase family protein [Aeromonas sp. YN13HZO-058]OLF23421.1 hypothetical protein BSP75_01350 [Aeromonas sp. YN13HZO-058]BBT81927.1 membrane protein [Aeromonas veronii]
MNKEISVAFDFLRIVACFFVVLLHSAAMGLYKANPNWEVLNVIDSFTRVSVPLFIMLSGALLFRPTPDAPMTVAKRIIKILACLFFWSAIYTWRDKDPALIVSMSFINDVLNGPVKYHLWYLYAVVGMYISIPILSVAYHASTKRNTTIYLLIWYVISAYLTLKYLLGTTNNIVSSFSLSYFGEIIGYLVLGKLLYDTVENGRINIRPSLLLLVYILISSATSIFVHILSSSSESLDLSLYSYVSPLTIIAASCFFTLTVKVGEKLLKYDKIIKSVASTTLGIYCIHILFVDYFYTVFIWIKKIPMDATYVFISSMIIFIISMIISFALKKSRALSFSV